MTALRVLIGCERSGVVRRAFRALGHDAWSCDLEPADDGRGHHIRGDLMAVLRDGWDVLIGHPPCTHLAVSGARHFAAKQASGVQGQALDFVCALMAAPIDRICIENPVSIISSRIRKPDQIIQPWMFGHAETKTTCLWLKGLPALVPTNVVEPDYMRKADGSYYTDSKGKRYSRIHFTSGRLGNAERSRVRSQTYAGIGAAMADQWGGKVDAQLPLELVAA